VMTVAGRFKRGDLMVSPNHYAVRMAYRPGDTVVMLSNLLMHEVGDFEGTHRGIVLFSHAAVMNWYNKQLKLSFSVL
jgi:hypothetical protein